MSRVAFVTVTALLLAACEPEPAVRSDGRLAQGYDHVRAWPRSTTKVAQNPEGCWYYVKDNSYGPSLTPVLRPSPGGGGVPVCAPEEPR